MAVALLIVGEFAGAISRSGGGKLESFELGFEAETPREYARANPLRDHGLRLWSDTIFGSSTFSAESFIELRTVESEFPEIAKLNRTGVEAEFSKLGWKRIASSDPCVDSYRNVSSSVAATVLLWGPGRGLVILGGLSQPAKNGVDEIISTLELTPGSCAW